MVTEQTLNAFKRRYDRQLRHVKVILMLQKEDMPRDGWEQLIESTKQSIISCPQDYLKGELPEHPILVASIERVFEGFRQDQKIRDLQKKRVF